MFVDDILLKQTVGMHAATHVEVDQHHCASKFQQQ